MRRIVLILISGLSVVGVVGGIIAYRHYVYLPVERASAANTPPKISSGIVSSGQPRSAPSR
jgi:hypothetical protein